MKYTFLKIFRITLPLAFITSMLGCSSIDAHAKGGYGKPFSGTTLAIVRQPCFLDGTALNYAMYPFSFVDMPLSLATDVVFLPVDLVMMFTPTTSYGEVVSVGCPRGPMI
ncbi:YceK/YidQ family lipoprotein [Vibrio alginolyticus]|uniref:YceK/YidQ family lipoprotein n=1 Tax=Vibrio alginolyticus TaxID=663 RepID=UPI00111085E0|nr:YceK/YidQ family lipoprotein [Vibrio alginolyticus]TMX48014.1 YceK/YidQ family lipoprotein [Vibrio alginolyticus]